jgi:hypothetical protein
VFDDDDDGAVGGASGGSNITASPQNNTIIPAGGVAVLYPADELNFMPERFNNAWGGGITLIGVDGFTSLSGADAVGLWPNRAAYMADAIPDVTTSPRRTFNSAVAAIDYAAVDLPEAGRSIIWNGMGSPTDTGEWRASQVGSLQGFISIETTVENSQINSTNDRGNPGTLPIGIVSPGLRITEIMFAPESPLVTVGYAEADFEWIEIFNNTPSEINFDTTPYVFDDVAGGQLTSANLNDGVLPAGEIAVLFNDETISREQMAQMWGDDINFIPVDRWPSLNNSGGDTLAIWDSYSDYDSEEMTASPRTYANAVAAITYNTAAGQDWPTILDGRSIWLNNLSGDPNLGASWVRAGTSGDTLSYDASPIFEMAVDHPGGDIGSPGRAPAFTTPTLPGDYNTDGKVDSTDYVVWRENDGSPNGYNTWRANFGRTSAAASATATALVPEPAALMLLMLSLPVAGLFIVSRSLGIRCRSDI